MPGKSSGPARFLHRVRVDRQSMPRGYPFDLPAVAWLVRSGGLTVPPGVTFLVGENGSGKSTLVEAIATVAGFNPEGGSRNFRFTARSSESSLGEHLVLTWGTTKPRNGFFLRAESYFNVATEIERLEMVGSYGGVSPHERSHGEAFLDLVTHRFGPRGFYVLDEPEAALSVRGCLALLARLADLVAQNCQILVDPARAPRCRDPRDRRRWRGAAAGLRRGTPGPPHPRLPRRARPLSAPFARRGEVISVPAACLDSLVGSGGRSFRHAAGERAHRSPGMADRRAGQRLPVPQGSS
jgi:predicted ATPase